MLQKTPGSVPLSRATAKVIGVYSGPRPILYPSFMEICYVDFFVILLTDKLSDKQTDKGSNIKTLNEIFLKGRMYPMSITAKLLYR